MKAATAVYIAAAVAGGLIAWRVIRAAGQAGDVIAATGQAVRDVITTDLNPASPENIVYRGASAVTGAITGRPGETLGGGLFNLLNPGQAQRDADLTAPTLIAPPGLTTGDFSRMDRGQSAPAAATAYQLAGRMAGSGSGGYDIANTYGIGLYDGFNNPGWAL